MTITMQIKPAISKQLKELSKVTRRTPEELILKLAAPMLNQIVADGDDDLMRMVL